jgi:hypothetical protein
MKRIFYALFLLMAFAFTANSASAQPPCSTPNNQVRFESFFYYPQSNVYYSFRTRQYIFPSHGGWQIASRLPRHIHIGREDRITVEHRGFDVWSDNARHQYTYGRRYTASPAIVYAPDKVYNRY